MSFVVSHEVADRYRKSLVALRKTRSQRLGDWQEVADYILPLKFRVDTTAQRDQSVKGKFSKILNNTATLAQGILVAACSTGLTSRTRPWFNLSTHDPEVAKFNPHRQWLDIVAEIFRTILQKSNAYGVQRSKYGDMATFGVAAAMYEQDDADILRGYPLPVGTYALCTDKRRDVTTLYYETEYSVEALVDKFGIANVSQKVKQDYDAGNYYNDIPVCMAVMPTSAMPETRYTSDADRAAGDPQAYHGLLTGGYSAIWFEIQAEDKRKLLKVERFQSKPFTAPRWDTLGNDVYGYGPGHVTLGDNKELQLVEERTGEVLDYITQPALNIPTALRAQGVSLFPGAQNYTDAIGTGSRVEPIWVPDGRALATDVRARALEARIMAGFYANVMLTSMNTDDAAKTAREIEELHEEKIVQLGSAIERIEDEDLSEILDRLYVVCMMDGLIPPPPPGMINQEIKVEFISTLSQAQKLVGLRSLEQSLGFSANLSQLYPDVLDNYDPDKLVRHYHVETGATSVVLNSEDVVRKIRTDRAKRKALEQAAAMAQPMKDAATAAKTLSETNLQNPSALKNLSNAIIGRSGL